jgi:hypothetical protein
MLKSVPLMALLVFGSVLIARDMVVSGQTTDINFNTSVSSPAYVGRHPRVLFDEAHNNADTARGRYKPFVDLVSNDGYRVVPNKSRIARNTLIGYRILVIVNPRRQPGNDAAPSFTEEERRIVKDWVLAGGALLLITDHLPFSVAAEEIASRFEIAINSGFTIDTVKYNKEAEDQTELVFTREDGLLGEHVITRGRDATERINRVVTFSGTSVKGPKGSTPLLKLSSTAMDVFPPDKPGTPEAPVDHKQVPAADRAQGVALQFGKGRVVVLADAAMLTAQVAPKGFQFGMNVTGADNRQFALNIMRWLSGLLK